MTVIHEKLIAWLSLITAAINEFDDDPAAVEAGAEVTMPSRPGLSGYNHLEQSIVKLFESGCGAVDVSGFGGGM